tara:strand:- start:2175 stop:3143 length:969 start_codon:yes stop_codon:yes gene_type:complete
VRGQEGQILADLSSSGTKWLAARGGEGGKGNARFLANNRRAPSFAEQGESGEEQWLKLELKLLADVALVGFPNVGKSTLISRISAARPKIADYPFTTLVPNLGVVKVGEDFEMVVADIPGLIEGASVGKGLGHQFLRHVERARVLVVLLDLAAYDGTAPNEQLDTLLKELGTYKPELLDRPRLLLASKYDVGVSEVPDSCIAISSVTGYGLENAIAEMQRLVSHERNQTIEVRSDEVIHRPLPKGIRVERSGDNKYEVLGRSAERAVALNDLTNIEALQYVQQSLERLGVNKALRRAGVKEGDIVTIGDLEFEFQEDGNFDF